MRASNEDTFVTNKELEFFAVVDGMGGHSSGAFASRTVTRAVSGESDLSVDVWELQLQAKDRLLLCSDGVHGCIDDPELARMASDDTDLDDVCWAIIAAANGAGGRDNSTVVVIEA